MQGRSLASLLDGSAVSVQGDNNFSMGWELLGKRAYRQADWKIVLAAASKDMGTLGRMASNPGSGNFTTWQTIWPRCVDLSGQHPGKLNELITLWEKYVQDNGVILPDWISGY